jgi:gliotoxin/aspirochlorine biosynthesis thioredoxin reductase
MRFAKEVTIYTNGSIELAAELQAALGPALGYSVESSKISKIRKGGRRSEVVVQLEDGSEQIQAFLGHKPLTRMNGPWAEQLGLEITPSGDPKTIAPFFSTNVSGVFACGDLASPLKIVPNAMLSGAAAGAGACAELQAERMGHQSMVKVVAEDSKSS